MSAVVPELPRGCGSWICTPPNGQPVEFFKRSNAELAAANGWRVQTAVDYLCGLNARVAA